jgi:hypothetical protein
MCPAILDIYNLSAGEARGFKSSSAHRNPNLRTLRLTCPDPGADLFARSYLRLRNRPFLRGAR